MDVNTPQQVFFGIRQDITDDFALLGSANWQDWSDFGESPATINNKNIGIDRELDDTWGAGLAFEYKLNSEWLLTCGYHYDSAMMDTSTRTADLPTGKIHRYGIGTEYKYSEKITFGMAFERADFGTTNYSQADVTGATRSGEYDGHIDFYTFNVNMKL